MSLRERHNKILRMQVNEQLVKLDGDELPDHADPAMFTDLAKRSSTTSHFHYAKGKTAPNGILVSLPLMISARHAAWASRRKSKSTHEHQNSLRREQEPETVESQEECQTARQEIHKAQHRYK